MMNVGSIVEIFEELNDYYIMKALFGNFRAVDGKKRQEILKKLSPEKVALLLNRMSVGVDNPKTAAGILRNLPLQITAKVVAAVEIAGVLRIFK